MNQINAVSLLLILVIVQSCSSFYINEVPQPSAKEPAESPVETTTQYDWGQHTGSRTTYDWGQHTPSKNPDDQNSTNNPNDGSQTTYDWGQHTGSRTTYDWGQHTSTKNPDDQNSTQTPTRTTYDWGQHTGSRTTYDWGQHTQTKDPNDNSTQDPNEENIYRCEAGRYTCKGTQNMCITLHQICDGKQDCPLKDDEDKRVCFPGFPGTSITGKNKVVFAGSGFMFRIKNAVIQEGSDAKLFNQNSDNVRQ